MAQGKSGHPVLAEEMPPPVDRTTIVLPISLRERLERFRRHPRETVADILTYIMDLADQKLAEAKA